MEFSETATVAGFAVCLCVCVFVGASGTHPYGGDWWIMMESATCGTALPPAPYYIHIPRSGVFGSMFSLYTKVVHHGTFVVSEDGYLAGSVISGRRDSPDVFLVGILAEKEESRMRGGVGTWFDAYGCEGMWTANED